MPGNIVSGLMGNEGTKKPDRKKNTAKNNSRSTYVMTSHDFIEIKLTNLFILLFRERR